jgi:hypothetical protein
MTTLEYIPGMRAASDHPLAIADFVIAADAAAG